MGRSHIPKRGKEGKRTVRGGVYPRSVCGVIILYYVIYPLNHLGTYATIELHPQPQPQLATYVYTHCRPSIIETETSHFRDKVVWYAMLGAYPDYTIRLSDYYTCSTPSTPPRGSSRYTNSTMPCLGEVRCPAWVR